MLRDRLLRVCHEKFCTKPHVFLGEVDIIVLHARQTVDTYTKQLLMRHYKVQYAKAMPRQVLAVEQSWHALQRTRYTEKVRAAERLKRLACWRL